MTPLLLLAVVALPDIVQPADVSPTRGDRPGSPHLTGPTTPIQRLYNDDLELSFWHGPADMTFSLAKNDVWDRRYFAAGKRIITLDDVKRVCLDPSPTSFLRAPNGPHGQSLGIPNAPQALYLAYDYPCPKPVGQLIVHCPDLAEAQEWTAGSADHGAVAARAASGPTKAALWTYLHRTSNLLIVRGEYAGLTAPLQIQLYRHQDTTPQGTSMAGLAHHGGDTGYDYSVDSDNGPLPAPTSGADGRFFWVQQSFPAESTFPGGFQYVMMAAVADADCETTSANQVTGAGVKTTIHPLTETTEKDVVGWLKEIRMEAERVNAADSGALAAATLRGPDASFTLYLTVVTTRDAADPLAAARQILSDALAAGPDALLLDSLAQTRDQLRDWRLSRVMHYNATSCTYADSTPWHGDYHFNEGTYTDTIVNGGSDELEQRLRLFESMRPALERNAREVYGCRGLAFSLVGYPIKNDHVVYSNVVWEWGLENTALMLQPFWQTFQYSWDLTFLRQRAYPMMREAARFYADYLTKGDDGYYHVIPTVSQEHWGFTPGFQLNRDSVGALSFIKYQLKACIQASELLGIDPDDRARWHGIVEHLAPYPTLDTPDGPVFCDVRDAPRLLNYNITANLIMSLWAEDISLDSPPDQVELARRSYRAIPDKEHSPRPGYLRRIRLVLGIPEDADLSPQGRVLSWPGRIHLYAGVPEGREVDDRFAGLRAVGGFEVSASHVGRDVRGVRVTSLAGNLCRVASPWGTAEVKVMELPSRELAPHRLEGDTIVFETSASRTYAILAGDELAQADLRFETKEQEIGHWDFTHGLDGGAHPATLVGDAKLTADGLVLDGQGSYAKVDRWPALDFAADQSFAVEVRFRLPAIVPPAMVPLVCSMATRQYCLMLSDGRPHFYLSSPRGDVYCAVTGDRLLTDGRWHTLRAVRDVADDTLRLYVDGEADGAAPDLTTGDFACEAPLTIGAYLWGDHSRYAEGTIAEAGMTSLGRLVARQ